MARSSRFLLSWVGCLVVVLGVVAAVNLAVDPYDVFGSARIAKLNQFKPRAKNHSMLAKTYQVERVRPVTVLLGSSRVHIGMDASDPAWPAEMLPVYNYAIPGGYATSSGLSNLREAAATGRLKNAIVFLDFQSFFDEETRSAMLTEDDRRYQLAPDGRPNPARPWQVLNDRILALLTMGALVDSMSTVAMQSQHTVLDLAKDGSSTEADFINAARSDGMHALFAQKTAFEVERAASLARTMAGRKGPLPNLEIVARLITFSRAHGIRLIIAIAPSHMESLELYWRDGLWPRMEQLKTELAAVVAREGAGEVALWDFSDYSIYAIEPVPPEGDFRTQTRWFWESTHFHKALGHLLIQRIAGGGSSGYGVMLTPANVAERNRQVRAQRNAVVCQTPSVEVDACPRPARAADIALPRDPS
jgi:hypothetical protein